MKQITHKHVDGLFEEYVSLLDEQIEIPLLLQRANEKYQEHLTDHHSAVYKRRETNDMFKLFLQVKKHEERLQEVNTELAEVENQVKDFLSFLKGSKIAYEKKDGNDKSKITFLFWLENGKVMTNR
ncbi:MAG: hypothetical protein ABJA57_03755 [Ginsengibacter sp.]